VNVPEAVALVAARIVHQDKTLVVVDKPPGWVTAGPPLAGRESIESLLVHHLRRRVWAVHQLDRDTSGLNLFVLQARAVAVWAERLKTNAPKRYLAITHGAPPLGRIDAPIADVADAGGKRWPRAVSADTPGARASVTDVVHVVPNASGDAALVELRPLTGRTHQVRVHLSHVGCPLFGERVHTAGRPPCDAHPRHALHAARLVWSDLTLVAPLPDDLVALALRLGITLG